MELVTGATGYVGGRLVSRFAPVDGVEAVRGDVVSGAGLERALEGCSAAYYLVHSMEAGRAGHGFAERDRRAARNFVEAAPGAGVGRVVYLGGVLPPAGTPLSPHLASRLEVEEMLLEGLPSSTALRASIVVGARSPSFRILVRLVERLRVLPFPAWRSNRTCPIDERDAVEYLARAPGSEEAAGRSLDVAGPDVLSYGQMIERIAESMGVGRAPLALRARQTPAASAVVAALTGQPVELVRPLMQSLESDLLPRDGEAERILGVRPRPFSRSVERALRDWEAAEPLAAR
jgi:uncharacterized protein YbjT (DUF2867 family)